MHRLSISSPSDGAGNEISTDLQCTQSVLDALKDLAAFQITAERKVRILRHISSDNILFY